MSLVYRCDACGEIIKDPHSQSMKEFSLSGGYEVGQTVRAPITKTRKIHLCQECFENLYQLGGNKEMENTTESANIKVRYLSNQIEKLEYIGGGKSNWIDLRAAEEVELKAGEFKLIPLGVAMQLPEGYEALIVPRSSTYKTWGIIQTNHVGVIDEKYCGDNDQWFFPARADKDTVIHVNDRICQFRIFKHQPTIAFEAVESLGNEDRGGIGSTGTN